MPPPASTPSKRTRVSRSARDRHEVESDREAAKAARKRERAEERRRDRERRELERELERALELEREQQMAMERERLERERGRDRTRNRLRSEHRSRMDLSPRSVSSNSTIKPASFSRSGPAPPPKDHPPDYNSVVSGANSAAASGGLVPVSTIIHPRVAVVLGIPRQWHFVLFVCRLLSVGPACYWGLPRAGGMLLKVAALWIAELQGSGMPMTSAAVDLAFFITMLDRTERRALLTESALALIWICASAYLSFFFTDCLMSRWLVNYTPQATVIRLISLSAMNAYVTSWVLYLAGGFQDPRLLLPAWISIATTLTIIYHITQRKINIRKETSASISVFSIASFISMVALLAQLLVNRSDSLKIPLLELFRQAWLEGGALFEKILTWAGNQNMGM